MTPTVKDKRHWLPSAVMEIILNYTLTGVSISAGSRPSVLLPQLLVLLSGKQHYLFEFRILSEFLSRQPNFLFPVRCCGAEPY